MEPKPGKRTTEFLLSALAMVAFVLNGTEFVNIPWDQMPYILMLAGGYAGARSWVKSSANGNGSAKAVLLSVLEELKKKP